MLEATALWWRIQLDPEGRALDAEFSAAVDRAIRTAEAWTDRTPLEAEAWFYLGAAYAARVQWRVLRDEKMAAARDGKRIKQALEQALELDPALDDAYFGLGMYKYYADVAPTAAKILRFLFLLPGGDRHEGLREMLRARSRGRLLQGEADYQLHIIYLWYEHQPDRALELLRGLQERYPGNPLFPAQIAHVQEIYQHDVIASLDTWRGLLAAAREQRVNVAGASRGAGTPRIARMLEAVYQTDHAIEQLQAIVSLKPDAPFSSLALALLRLGEATIASVPGAPPPRPTAQQPLPRHPTIRSTYADRPPSGSAAEAIRERRRHTGCRSTGWRRARTERSAVGERGVAPCGRARSTRSGRPLSLRPRPAGAQKP